MSDSVPSSSALHNFWTDPKTCNFNLKNKNNIHIEINENSRELKKFETATNPINLHLYVPNIYALVFMLPMPISNFCAHLDSYQNYEFASGI